MIQPINVLTIITLFSLSFACLSCSEETQSDHETLRVEGQLMIDCDLPYANRKVSLFRDFWAGDILNPGSGHSEAELLSTTTNANGEFVFPEVSEAIGLVNSVRWWTESAPSADRVVVNIELDYRIEFNPEGAVDIGTMHIMERSGDIDLRVIIHHAIDAGTVCKLIFDDPDVEFVADGSNPIVQLVDNLTWHDIDCSQGLPCTYLLNGIFIAETSPGLQQNFQVRLDSPCPDTIVEWIIE